MTKGQEISGLYTSHSIAVNCYELSQAIDAALTDRTKACAEVAWQMIDSAIDGQAVRNAILDLDKPKSLRWCDHLKIENGKKFFLPDPGIQPYVEADDTRWQTRWQWCPICGLARPK